MLGEELKRQSLEQSTLSVVILELINYPDLVQQFSEHEVRALLSSIAKTVNDSTNQQGQAFHFKQENQLAFLFSNLDFDGASLFCLEILEKMNEPGWVITHEPIALEVITGFSSYTGNETGDELIEKAQNLLEMQKL
jgi:PleD family two-component response regulator